MSRMSRDETGIGDDIIVEKQHDLGRRPFETRLLCCRLSAVFDQNRDQLRVVRRELTQKLVRSIRAAVDHDDYLPGGVVGKKGYENVRKQIPSVIRRYHD